ncbi:restriction endonuclease subunit S [Vibrio parahaemolyticus]
MVPNGWTVNRLDEIAKVSSGGTPSKRHKEYWDNGDIPWIRTTEVQNCVIREQDTQVYITKLGLEKSSAKLFPKGTVLMAMIGQGKTRGQVALLDFEATTNQNCAAIIFNEGQSPDYYFNFLQTQYESIRGYSNSAGQSNLSGGLVKSLLVTVPPFSEQRKIAKILSTWDKAITTTEKLIETSKQQKKALMQQLLTGKKRLVNPETGKAFEGEWEEVKLGDVAAMNSGGTPKSSVSEYYDGKHPWVSIADMTKHGKWISKTEKSLTDEGIANSSARLYPKGTVLYAMYASIGECSIATVELCSSQAILGIRPNSNLINIYLYYYLINLKGKIILTGQQGTQSNLNAGMVKGFTIKLPTIVEQQKIASVLTAADKEIEVLEAKLAHFKQEKKALMQQLLTGKRRVKVDEDVAA